MHLMDAELYKKFKGSERLPSPKGVALAVIRLLQREEYKVDDLVQLINSDPAMVGRLLMFANSAANGNAQPVADLVKAVLMLGVRRVRDLVLGFSIFHDYRSGACELFDYETFWSRSLATAIAAQALAKHGQLAAEEAFTLGLLCDIGVLALASFDCGLYADSVRLAGANPTPMMLVKSERSVFGTDHRELGATVMTEWGLPESLVAAAYFVENAEGGRFADGSRRQIQTLSLSVARAMAEICVVEERHRWDHLPGLYGDAARIGITPGELAALADDVVRRWNDWGTALRLQTQNLPPFAELLSTMALEGIDVVRIPRRTAVIIGIEDASAAALAATIRSLGFVVNQVANGVDGLMVVLRENPQLIIIALDCAELDGASFCRAYRSNPLSRETHLLLLGRHDQEEALSHAVERDVGADDYLLWPVSPETLRVRLRTADKISYLREKIRRERRGLLRAAGEWAGSHRRMMEMALNDPLTHLPNRRYGLDFFAAEWVFARADNRPLACLMVDIDHFKAINDTYGHDAGDAVLAGVAHILSEYCRSEDMAFRYGGEEFCIVCTDTDLMVARIVAERIRAGVQLESYTFGEREASVTVSIGVAAISPEHANAEELLKDADSALFRAKEGGRNRVEG